MKENKKVCIECNENIGEFKIYFSKTFRKQYGRKGMEKEPYCLECLIGYLTFGSKTGFYPEYIIKIKRIKNPNLT